MVLRLVSYGLRALVAVVVLGAGFGLFEAISAMRIEPARTEATDSGLLVRTIVAVPRSVPRVWQGYGTARAMDTSTVSAEISARVVDRPDTVEVGSEVSKGDILVRLDTAILLSQVQAAEASVASVAAQISSLDAETNRLEEQLGLAKEEEEISRRNLERVREAAGGGAGTESDVDAAASQFRRAQRTVAVIQQQLDVIPPRREQLNAQRTNLVAELAIAQENLDRATVVAPMAGALQEVSVDVGDLVNVGSPIARIVNIDRLEIPLRLAISASGTVRIGDEVELRADGPVASTWSGVISRIAPEADTNSRTMTAFVEVVQAPGDQAGPRLLPGQFVVGRVTTRVYADRILVPRRAVAGDRVMVVGQAGSISVARPVDVRVEYHLEMPAPEIEPDERQWAVVESGLRPGDRVVVSNLDQLVGGMRIEPTDVGELSTSDSAGDADGADEAGGS